jgi:uncharacterized protein YegP (UPF0339 family)
MFKVYKERAGEFRWRLRAAYNEIAADSNEGHTSKASCLNGINVVKVQPRRAREL